MAIRTFVVNTSIFEQQRGRSLPRTSGLRKTAGIILALTKVGARVFSPPVDPYRHATRTGR